MQCTDFAHSRLCVEGRQIDLYLSPVKKTNQPDQLHKNKTCSVTFQVFHTTGLTKGIFITFYVEGANLY